MELKLDHPEDCTAHSLDMGDDGCSCGETTRAENAILDAAAGGFAVVVLVLEHPGYGDSVMRYHDSHDADVPAEEIARKTWDKAEQFVGVSRETTVRVEVRP